MAGIPLMYAQEDVEFGGKPGILEDFAFNNNVKNASIRIRMGKLCYISLFCVDNIIIEI